MMSFVIHGSSQHRALPQFLVVKCGICYGEVCLSVRLSVCHTRESRLNGSRHRNMLCTVR